MPDFTLKMLISAGFAAVGYAFFLITTRAGWRWAYWPAFVCLSLASIGFGHDIAEAIGLPGGLGAPVAWIVFAGVWFSHFE